MRVTRRGVLIGAGFVGGGLLLGTVGVASYVAAYDQRNLQQGVMPTRKLVTQWISVAPDGRIILHGPHTEMGQGTQTSLLQIVLDELDADPATTGHELAPADPAFTLSDLSEGVASELAGVAFDGWTGSFLRNAMGRAAQLGGFQFTGGSLSVRFTGWVGIRRAAASARMMLAQAGAEVMGVPVHEVHTLSSRVHHEPTGQSIGYGDLADVAALLPLPDQVTYKDPSTYRFIGTSFDRIDVPEKVFGDPVYGIDVQVPGMRYAAVAPPPLAQGRVTGVTNREEVQARRGVEAIVVLEDGVAVVADNPWRAEQAVRQLDITCDPPVSGVLDATADRALRLAGVEQATSVVYSYGEDADSLDGDDVVQATYTTPYYLHVPMEPLNATVWEEDGKHHVATGTQGPLSTRVIAAEALGRPLKDVILHTKTMGGSFGRRNALVAGSINWVQMACRIQKAVGGAVKMTWSREADIRISTYHPSDAARMQARLGPDGLPVAWLHHAWADMGMADEAKPPYNIPSATARTASGEPLLPYGAWRSVSSFTTVYFTECFIDELAAAAGRDPLEYRLALLDEPGKAVLQRAADMAGWTGPRQGDHGFGIAYGRVFGSRAAVIAEVSMQAGTPKLHRMWCALDCGIPVNPRSVESQAQGGLFWGISAALYGRVDIQNGAIVQSNFHNYRVATFRDAPLIEVSVMQDTGQPIGGAGELTTPLGAPALANALAQLAPRKRDLPLVS